MSEKPLPGSITWQDLTVPDAREVSTFYSKVVGWQISPVSMGDYDDFNMNIAGNGKTASGICHSKGINAGLPAQWLIYITVDDVDKSAEICKNSGGEVLSGPHDMGSAGRYCVIKDPAGAVAALYQFK